MPNLYTDLLCLQTIPDAFSRWEPYRQQLTRVILERTAPGSTALIVGAGRCNDFDLNRLKEHFSAITLLDRDLYAMEEGIALQEAAIPHDRLKRIDVIGIPDDTYTAIADRMTAGILPALRSGDPGADRFTEAFLHEIDTAWQNRDPDMMNMPGPVADYVICCGVHSQLMTIFPQMAGIFRRYVRMDVGAVHSLVRSMIPDAVRALNAALFRWAGKGVLIGLEEKRIGMEGAIDGAWQAAQDLAARGLSDPGSEVLTWPFDVSQEKQYAIRISLFRM